MALQTPCDGTLADLLARAQAEGFDCIPFHEPDLDNQLTAVAFSPHPFNRKLLAGLPLAGRGGSVTKHTAAKQVRS